MDSQLEISGPMKPLGRFLQRFHTTIFILFITGCLGLAVLLLYGILSNASLDPNYKSDKSPGYIDQATLDRINGLHSSDGPFPAPPTSTMRINPFAE
jgi:hypothetical protein